MYKTVKSVQVAAEMRSNNLTIIGISESRWTGSGQRKLSTRELLLFSEHEEEGSSHTQGVALMFQLCARRGGGVNRIGSLWTENSRRLLQTPTEKDRHGH